MEYIMRDDNGVRRYTDERGMFADIRREWPDAALYANDGFAVRTVEDLVIALERAERVLIWACEADSIGDAGERAVAEIVVKED